MSDAEQPILPGGIEYWSECRWRVALLRAPKPDAHYARAAWSPSQRTNCLHPVEGFRRTIHPYQIDNKPDFRSMSGELVKRLYPPGERLLKGDSPSRCSFHIRRTNECLSPHDVLVVQATDEAPGNELVGLWVVQCPYVPHPGVEERCEASRLGLSRRLGGDHIFDACKAIDPSPRGEFELPAAVQYSIDTLGAQVRAVPLRLPVLDLTSRIDIDTVGERVKDLTVRL